MAEFILGARLHDYGSGTPDELFAKVAADGLGAVQLAYKKCVPGVKEYADITPELVADTVEAGRRHHVWVGVLGTYVELAIDDEAERRRNLADFKSQLAVCGALGAGCIGTETTSMALQPAGTSRERAQYLLCKSLEEILPEAERLGVTVGIEPVFWHSMNTPEATRHILDTMQSPALKVIFDAGNLLTANMVDKQPALWERVGSLLGDKIIAVHYKGEAFDEAGNPVSTSLEDSVIDFDSAFEMLRALPQKLPVLREEAVPARAASDIAIMRRHCFG